jgi:V8-like Glu-specific endopeptidase
MLYRLLFLIILSMTANAYTGEKSINPTKVEYNLFALNSGKKQNNNFYRVSGIAFQQHPEEYIAHGSHFQVDAATYEKAHSLGKAVFRATPGDTSSAFGTAFAVGGNFILTNQHVLSVSRKNTDQCRNFSLKLNQENRDRSLRCQKVHYCDKDLDFCLIEMAPNKKGDQLSDLIPLRLKKTAMTDLTARTMAIGNTRGLGLHASTGHGLYYTKGLYLFYAPVFGGNSGGPLFNDEGDVIAVVRSQSKELYGLDSYNVAITIDQIYQELLYRVDESVLEQLNFIN